jgi:transposase
LSVGTRPKETRITNDKPYRKTNKNDYLDAEAIAEAARRPTMHFGPIKTNDQLDLRALRVRDRWVVRLATRTWNYDTQGPSHLAAQFPPILEEEQRSLSGRLRKARVIIYAYNHHVRLLSPETVVVKQPQFTRVEEPTFLCNH